MRVTARNCLACAPSRGKRSYGAGWACICAVVTTTRFSRTIALVLSALSLLSVSACASMGFTSSEKKLVKQASFDHNCPAERIQVKNSMEGGVGDASFVLDVCGTERRYKRMGTAYYDADKGSPLRNAPS